MDLQDFTHDVQPHHKRSRLLKFKAQIGTLKRQGYSDMQIRQWLSQNGCEVSRENVRRFIKRYLTELNGVSQTDPPVSPLTALGTDQAPQLIQPIAQGFSGSALKESAAERILRQTREQRNEAARTLFKHDKTGNNH